MIHLFYINFLLSLSIYSTMETFHHILKLSAGVGLFFFIYLLEESLKNLSGSFKLFYNALQRMRLAPLPGCDSNWYSSE
jgi:hypothetical protein